MYVSVNDNYGVLKIGIGNTAAVNSTLNSMHDVLNIK